MSQPLEVVSSPLGSRGYTYHVTKLPTKKGRALLVRLIKVLGPVVGALLSNARPSTSRPIPKVATEPKGEEASADAMASAAAGPVPVTNVLAGVTGNSVHKALCELAARLSEADLEEVCKVFGEFSEVSHEETPDTRPKLTPAYQDFHFSGQYPELFAWIAYCLEENFKGFFSGSPIASAIAEAGAAAMAVSPKGSSPFGSPTG